MRDEEARNSFIKKAGSNLKSKLRSQAKSDTKT